MTDLPRQVDRRVRRAIAALKQPWRLTKTRDHYFIEFEGGKTICIGSNGSRPVEHLVQMTLRQLKKLE